MRILLLSLVFLSFLSFDLFSQRKELRQARAHLAGERYVNALDLLNPLLRGENVSPQVYLLLGQAYLNLPGGSVRAEELLIKATALLPLRSRPSNEAIEAKFYLGQAMHLNYKFNEAIELYDLILTSIPASRRNVVESVQREKNYSVNALVFVNNPVNFDIHTLGVAINSVNDEHSPVVSLDESSIFFTSNRPTEDLRNRDDAGRFFERIFVSYWRDGAWTESQELILPGEYIGNRATVGISADGQTILFYQNDGAIGNLYSSRLRFGNWTEPEPFPAPINSSFNETHASLSLDGNSIWFTSDRPGGFGGKDIYVSHLLPDGFWGEPINAGPNVNTPYNEESPYLHPDGNFLFFSSEGHNSMGGFDIFRSEIGQDYQMGEPVNLGYPINTPDDDIFYMPTPDGQRVYYASRQSGGIGATDVYLITFPSNDERSLAVMACHVYNSDEKPNADAVVRIFDSASGESQGVFRPNPISGKFVAVLASGKKYKMSIEAPGYLLSEHEFLIPLRDMYGSRQRAFYQPSVILEKDQEVEEEEEEIDIVVEDDKE